MNNSEHFQDCLSFVFKHEGGGKLITDSGGLTSWGISSRAYPDEDIAHMTKEQASEIFYTDYFPHGLDCPLDLVVFDASVNCGVDRSVRWLQSSINGYLTRDPIDVDGILGPITIKAVEFCPEELLLLALLNRRLLHYYGLRKSQPKHFPGWIGRVADLIGVCSKGCFDATLIK